MNFGLADALCRQLGPAMPCVPALQLIGLRLRRPLRRCVRLEGRPRRCSEEKNYFFFFFAFLAFFAFFAFFAMLPSKQLSELAMSDAHPV
jgi:hypothetical protein